MKLKMNASGNVVVQDGKPVYVHANGREEAVDVPGTIKSIHQICFSTSKYVADKMSIPADMAQAQFRDSFAVEDGKIMARDRDGNKIYSRARPGELASFDEALEAIVSNYSHKGSILKSVEAPGGQGTGGKNVIKRAQFDVMTPAELMPFFKNGGTVID
jgi:hypothetical protein